MCEIKKLKEKRMPGCLQERVHRQLAAGLVSCCAGQLTVIFFSNKKKIPMRFRGHRTGGNSYTNQVSTFRIFFFFNILPPLTFSSPHAFLFSLFHSIPCSQCTCLTECIRVERSSIRAFKKLCSYQAQNL